LKVFVYGITLGAQKRKLCTAGFSTSVTRMWMQQCLKERWSWFWRSFAGRWLRAH